TLDVNQPEVLALTSATVTTPILCNGGTATVTIVATGGTAPYSYTFNSQTNATGVFTGVLAGAAKSYSITDANNCGPVTGILDVNQPAALALTSATVTTPILCNGGTATVTIVATGGTAPYSYTFNSQTNATGVFTGVLAGAAKGYSFTDANNCGPVTGTLDVTQPAVLALTSATVTTPILCNSGTATVTIVATGGTAPYSYTFNGQTNATGVFTGVLAGAAKGYSITDANSCGPVTGTLDVNQPAAALTVTTSQVNVLCFGASTGSATATPAGGTGAYSYSWNTTPVQATATATGLGAGTYTVTVTDVNLCTATASVTITQPAAALVFSLPAVTDVSCTGSNNGKIIIIASGGTGAISYSINPNIGTQSPVGTFNNLTAQAYNITAYDANGCTVTVLVSVGTVPDVTYPTFTAPNNITIYSDNSCNYNASPTITGQPSNETDNCPLGAIIATYSDGPRTYGACVGTSTILRTWSLTDAHGNTTTHQQTITIADNIRPALTVPPTITIQCTASILPANTGQASATDNCAGSITIAYSDVTVSGNCAGRSIITRTWTATDCSGNSTSGTQIINLQDTQPPVLACTSFSVANPDAIPASDSYVNISATDNCGGPIEFILTSEEYAGLSGAAGFCPSSVTRKYVAKDQCGNTSTECTQVITVLDHSGCEVCQNTVPFFPVILAGAPDSLWISPSVVRAGLCCGAIGPPPPRCISFNVYLDKDAVGLIFNINSGALPPGALFYQVDCGPQTSVGEAICLAGDRFYTITFCKPGNNSNSYSIQSISGITGTTGLITRQDAKCADTLSVIGIDPATVTWTVKSPNDQTLLRYLSCTNCADPIFTPDLTTPPNIVYEVCGTIFGTNLCGNTSMTDCKDVTVVTLPAITIAFDINTGNICANNIPTINATVSPINLNYTYQWFNGPDGTGTLLSTDPYWRPTAEGSYSLVVTETLSGVKCNMATYNFNIVFDVLGPTIIAPPLPLDVECNDPNAAQQIVNWLETALASDGATSIPVTDNYNGITMACGSTLTVTFSAQDICGNVATATGEIRIIDTQVPAITCPVDVSGYADNAECFATGIVLGTATATDNCSTPVVTNNAPAQFPVGTTIVTWTATDACGNTATCSQSVTIIDNNQPPTITCPVDVVQTALPNNCALNNVIIPDPVTTDNCGVVLQTWSMSGVTTGNSPATGINSVSGQTFNVGITTVTYTVADAAGNTATCAFNVWIKDLVKPVFSSGCPVDVTQPADAGLCTASVTIPPPSITDPCNEGYTVVNSFNNTNNASGLYPVGVTIVHWTITDASGNTNTCDQIITITDNQPPVVTCPAPVTVTAAPPLCVVPAVVIGPLTATDNCGIATITWTKTGATTASGSGDVNGTSFNVGDNAVTYTVTDIHGNISTCSFTVTVHDQVPPTVITCPADVTRNADANACSAALVVPAPVVSDPCGEIVSVLNSFNNTTDASGTYPIGTTVVTWTFTDQSGNVTTCVQNITINDLLPTLQCPPDIVRNADFNKPYASNVLIGTPIYSDNCPGLTLTWVSSNPTPGASALTGINIDTVSIYYAGVTTIIYTLTDAHNNTVSSAFTVTVLAKPVILCQNDTTRSTDPGVCTATLDPGFPTKVSGVEPITWAWEMTGTTTASGTGSPITPNPYPFNVGITTITWTATNISGIDTCTQLVTVVDNEPPTFNAAPKAFCVNNIITAIYDGAGDINPERPDYYIFQAGDLDITGINDNCCALQDMVVHWRIDFTPTPDPLPPHNLVNTPSISGTGQPSENIELPGDGVTFLDVTHKITYWIVDCHNNTSAETTVDITIKPRPNIIKN
ncbi:MAG: HYR domain-containing protein, partial [Bacteroidetes bacterium]